MTSESPFRRRLHRSSTGGISFLGISGVLAVIVAINASARAGTLSFTCNANVNSLGPSNLCNSFNTTLANLYNSTFANANASIYIQFGTTGLGSSSQYLEAIDYASYLDALTTDSSGDVVDTKALASLPITEPAPFTNTAIILTGALGGALGVGDIVGETPNGTFCGTPGVGNCYNGVITLATPAIVAGYGDTYYYENGAQPANSYDIYSVIEHETDELLGTLSCGGTVTGAIADRCGTDFTTSADLFRYNVTGSRVGYISTPAYFSYDGGLTSVAPYNYLPNNADYGDFSTTCAHVQDAFGCPGTAFSILNDGGAEVTMLDALGYNLNASPTVTPEPGSLLLVGSGLALVSGFVRRRI